MKIDDRGDEELEILLSHMIASIDRFSEIVAVEAAEKTVPAREMMQILCVPKTCDDPSIFSEFFRASRAPFWRK